MMMKVTKVFKVAVFCNQRISNLVFPWRGAGVL